MKKPVRPRLAVMMWAALGVLVTTTGAAACTSSDDDSDGQAGTWVLTLDEQLGVDGTSPAVSGTFGTPFIDRFLGPEQWDVADGAPPGYRAWVGHSDLIALGELVANDEADAGADDGGPAATLRIDDVVKGEVADLAVLTKLPVAAELPTDVTIVIGAGKDGSSNLLVDPYDADRDRFVQVLLGGPENSPSDRSLDELLATADVVLIGTATGEIDGSRVGVEVTEVLRGDAESPVESVVWIDVGLDRAGRLPRGASGIWFVADDDGELRSVTTSYPGPGELTITEHLRTRLAGS